jgi:Icc-related predicted phosphoesterase
MKDLTICCISDTHGQHRKLHVPKCDLLIFAGDAHIETYEQLEDFNNWLETLPVKDRLVIGGNHDKYLQDLPKKECQLLMSGTTYLENDTINYKGLKIFGSPFSLEFNNWSFMLPDSKLAQIWELIEPKTDIVITHGPAFGVVDKNVDGEYCGSKSLKKKLTEIKPLLHVCGHIHESFGTSLKGDYLTINASILDERYELLSEYPMAMKYRF